MRDYNGRLQGLARQAFAGGRTTWRRQLRTATLLGRLRLDSTPVPAFTFDEHGLTRLNTLVRRAELTRSARDRRKDPGQLPQVAQTYTDLAAASPPGSSQRIERLALAASMWSLAGYQANAASLAQAYLAELGHQSDPNPAEVEPVTAAAPAAISAIAGTILCRDISEVGRLGAVAELTVPQLENRLLAQPLGVEPDLSDISMLAAYGLIGRAARGLARFWRVGDRAAAQRAQADIRTARDVLGNAGVVDTWLLVDNLHYVVEDIIATSPWLLLRRAPSWNRLWERYLRSQALGDHPVVQVWPSQRQVLDAGLLDRARPNLTICMPTSAGKTHTAEWAVLDAMTWVRPLRGQPLAVYIVPSRALAAEVERHLRASLSPLGLRVSGIFGGAELVDYELGLVSGSDVLVLTSEKFDLLLRNDDSIKDRLALLVADEGHLLGTEGARGLRLELLLTRVKQHVPAARLLLLSAVLPNGEDIAGWLDPDGCHLASVEWTPSNLRLGVFSWRGQDTEGQRGFVQYQSEDIDERFFLPHVLVRRKARTKLHPASKTEIAAELALHYQKLGPVLIVAPQKPSAVSAAKAVLKAATKADRRIGATDDGDLPAGVVEERERVADTVIEFAGSDHPLIEMVRAGIGFHHADVPEGIRHALEQAYRAGALGILCSTSTLAQGVNLPTKTVLISGTRHSQHHEMSVRDFRNTAGRAGRAFRETEGHAILVADTHREAGRLRRKYLDRPTLEPILSQLAWLYVRLLKARLPDVSPPEIPDPETFDLLDPTDSDADLTEAVDLQLLAILSEEVVETDDEPLLAAAVEGALSTTLASRQLGASGISIRPFTRFATRRIREIRQRVPEATRRAAFLRTGLSIAGCETAQRGAQRVAAAISHDPDLLLQPQWPELRELLLEAAIAVEEVQKSATAVGAPSEALPALVAGWMAGHSHDDLRMAHGAALGTSDPLKFASQLDRVIVHDLAWALSAVVQLLSVELGTEVSLPLPVTSIAAMAKYGVGTPAACFAASLGVRNRQDAHRLGGLFPVHAEGSFAQFVAWVGTLDSSTLALVVSGETAEVLLDRAAALNTPRRTLDLVLAEEGTVTVPLRGVRPAGAEDVLRFTGIGEPLVLEREHHNPADRNAIAVLTNGGFKLGYLAREHARVLALLLDLEDGPALTATLASHPPMAEQPARFGDDGTALVEVSVTPTDSPGASNT